MLRSRINETLKPLGQPFCSTTVTGLSLSNDRRRRRVIPFKIVIDTRIGSFSVIVQGDREVHRTRDVIGVTSAIFGDTLDFVKE